MLKPVLDLMLGNVRKDSNGRVIAATLLDSENNPCFLTTHSFFGAYFAAP